MEPTQPTSPHAPTPNAGAPLVEYIRTQRQNAGYLLAFLSVVFLALTAFLALKAYRAPAAAEKPADKSLVDPFDPEKPPELPKASEPVNLKRGDYTVGWVGTMLAFLIVGAAGMWLIAGPVPPGEEQQRAEARVLLLAIGGLLGSLLILFGLWYFYRWSDSLVNWLDKGEAKEARWVLIPILMAVAGAGLVFAAIQPARADERNNSGVRRLVYGANFGLTVLLLFVALVVANVLFAVRVPNKLDATETGFYSITDHTTDLLRRLDPPVNAYAILSDSVSGRVVADLRQFLLACQDSSEGRFKVRFISPVADKVELNSLMSKYPQLGLILEQRGNFGAVVLTTGSDEKRHVVIPNNEFLSTSRDGQQQSFAGELRLFKELTLLADNQVKPVIYFTQSHGELNIIPEDQAPEEQKGARLRAYLEKNYLDVRPLPFPLDNPTVPDDAAVVVIAGPRVPFSEAAVGALRKYLNTPRAADGKKGKLIVLASAFPGPDGKGVMKTGLEGLLGEMNVRVGDKFVYSQPTQQHPAEWISLAGFARSSASNPITIAIVKATNMMPFLRPREIAPLTANPSLQASTLMVSVRPTWLEDNRVADIDEAVEQLKRSPAIQGAKDLSDGGRPLAAVVSEAGTARAAVFGSSEFVSDYVARRHPPDSAPITFDLIGVTVDWLRERPPVAAVGIEAKQYQEYRFPEPASVDTTRLLYLPLTLGLLAVIGLGAGVWVIRRK